MTTDAGAQWDLLVTEFYPELGEYLAGQYAAGYDAGAGRARFLAWLNDQTDPLREYLLQIGKVPPLDAEQEAELARRIEAGRLASHELAGDGSGLTGDRRADLERITEDGARAQTALLEANLRVVVSLAKRFTGRGMLFLDLIQEGNLGLIRAAEKFDYTKGIRFSAYATWWVRQAITRALAVQDSVVRVPVPTAEALNRLAAARQRLLRDSGCEPTLEGLAAELGVSLEEVIEIDSFTRRQADPPRSPDETTDPAAG